MKFTKMEGIGNDYVYVNCFQEKISNPSEIAKLVSDRHFGVGSDGLILIKPSQNADFFMEMYNADGSQGEMCGNGIRCVAKYVYDYGLTDKTHIVIDTLAGMKQLQLEIKDNHVQQVCVNMGKPELEAQRIPVQMPHPDVPCVKEDIEVAGTVYKMTCVSMGNPHAVIYMDHIDDLEIEKTGPLFEHHPVFPNRTNTEFVQVIDRHTVRMRVWERGAGETLACGTGACAVAVAGVLNNLNEKKITVKLLGGDLLIEWKEDGVYMTGPARVVFDGEIDI